MFGFTRRLVSDLDRVPLSGDTRSAASIACCRSAAPWFATAAVARAWSGIENFKLTFSILPRVRAMTDDPFPAINPPEGRRCTVCGESTAFGFGAPGNPALEADA